VVAPVISIHHLKCISMKKMQKKSIAKLILKKETVANLTLHSMQQLKGGGDTRNALNGAGTNTLAGTSCGCSTWASCLVTKVGC
jgi:hypothetical protein